MMIRGLPLVNALTGSAGSVLKQQRLSLIKPPTALSYMRPISTINNPVVTMGQTRWQNPAVRPAIGEMTLLNKRFLHNGTRRSSGQESGGASYWVAGAKIVAAAVGAIIGLGADVIFGKGDGISKPFTAACASNDEQCCVEKKCEDTPCLRKMECEEEMIIKANADLEKALKEVKSKAIEYTESAMKAYCAAIVIMKEYMDQGYCIIDSDQLEPPQYEEAWCCVYKIAKERCEKVKDALQKGQCAWELLCRLREVIESGKTCKYTSCNPLLVTAEESFTCAETELLKLKSQMDCVTSDHDMVAQYQEVIQKFRKELKSEVDKIVDSGTCDIKFAEQETALMIIQAYKKAVSIQKEAAQVMICSGNIPERLQKTLC